MNNQEMPRYILFTGWTYYPNGGWGDFQGGYESIDAAKKVAAEMMQPGEDRLSKDWWHIVDLNFNKIVARHPE